MVFFYRVTSFLGLLDYRRLSVKVGSSMVWMFGAVGMFAEQYGYSGVLLYLAILSISRALFTELSTSITSRFAIGVTSYQYAPVAIIAVGMLAIVAPDSDLALHAIPVLIALFVAAFFPFYYEIYYLKGVSVESLQATEATGTAISAVLTAFVTLVSGSIWMTVVLGSAIVILSFFIEIGVSDDELLEYQYSLKEEAANRSKRDILRGVLIVASVSSITYCSTTDLRLHLFADPDSAVMGVVVLALTVAVAEVSACLVVRKHSFDSPLMRRWGFVITCTGFGLMFSDLPWHLLFGYVAVTTVSRAINRASDYSEGRKALKGVGNRVALREITRYRAMALLTPLLWVPSILPLVGLVAALVLILVPFES